MQVMEVGAVTDTLLAAIQTCQSPPWQDIIMAVTSACLKQGLSSCPRGYLLKPVSMGSIRAVVRQDCPDKERMLIPLLWGRPGQEHYTFLRLRHTERHIMIDLNSLISTRRQRDKVRDILRYLHTIKLHPEDAGYEAAVLLYSGGKPGLLADDAAQESDSFAAQMPVAAFAAPYVMVNTVAMAGTVRATAVKAGRIAVDCGGCCLSRTGRLCLVQVMAGGTCYMFDVFQAGLCITVELKAMLEDPAIVKVMHDCRQDSAALYYQMGIKLQSIYDTQVAHGLADLCKSTVYSLHEPKQERTSLVNLLATHKLPAHSSKQGGKL